MSKFGTDRIKNELTYIAKKMVKYNRIELNIADTNFGMGKRDEEFGEHIRMLQDKYGWPNAINTATSKGNWNRVINIAERVRFAFSVGCSVQSMNEETLNVIKRQNMPMPLYNKVVADIKSREGSAVAEVIIPLPLETKKSFFEGLRLISKAGVDKIIPHTTMMLMGTPQASQAEREKYEMVTRFRLLPKQFGDYRGEKCFEIEEVCIQTNTMSFEEYLDCRGFAFICTLFAQSQYDAIRMVAAEVGISAFDWYLATWELVTKEETGLTSMYNSYISDLKDELFLKESDVFDFYSDPENYKKLVEGKLGRNLIRKYLRIVVLEEFTPSVEVACRPLRPHLSNFKDLLDNLQEWVSTTRDMGLVLSSRNLFSSENFLDLSYDVDTWYKQHGDGVKPLVDFNHPVKYRVIAHEDRLEELMELKGTLYRNSTNDLVEGLVAKAKSSSYIWSFCEPVSQ